jgi:hypothetical protein
MCLINTYFRHKDQRCPRVDFTKLPHATGFKTVENSLTSHHNIQHCVDLMQWHLLSDLT